MKKYRRLLKNFAELEDGMTTAEYAVGTVAAAGLGGLLINIVTSAEMRNLIWSIVEQAFKYVFS